MKVDLNECNLKLDVPWTDETFANFRPPSWPPPPDWPVVIGEGGVVVSRWADGVWNLAPWGKTGVLNFGDGDRGRAVAIDKANADLLRLVIGDAIWGPRGCVKPGTIFNRFNAVRPIFVLCSQNGILASRLMRFPNVRDKLRERIAPSTWDKVIVAMHRAYDARELLGFAVFDAPGLKWLAHVASDYEPVQTPYIPPRIWKYLLSRLRECIDDFLAHRKGIEDCFQFCLDAYAANYGSLQAALKTGRPSRKAPFTKNSDFLPSCLYLGPFAETASHFGIRDVLAKWYSGSESPRVTVLSTYLSLVSYASLAYIANFTLQRKEEVGALRSSCLVWEDDENFGRVPLICGETTKTQEDSDARWVASPSVEVAVDALTAIARLRMTCTEANPALRVTAEDMEDPFLLSSPTEPWTKGAPGGEHRTRTECDDLKGVLKRYPLLLDAEQLRITEDDLKVAQRVTRGLPEDEFAVGRVWPLAWHQFRRTTAVNMFASGKLSDSSMQQQLKHTNRLMPLYYGRGHTRLHLNEEVERTVLLHMYQGLALRLKDSVTDTFASPNTSGGAKVIPINLITTSDIKTLAKLAKTGKVSFREHRLGACMKPGPCEYGGVESVARCAGGDVGEGGKPCADVLYDREKEPEVRKQLQTLSKELRDVPKQQPRHKALSAEVCALKNYLDVVTTR